ncbi:N-acetyl-gamma-glutamyl-phosphate reductase [Candidatus Gracilibacteria bacterium]|nr:N-acetyl-gamma-glutamyl-phosphate reductase [Candidatus Gracilibacteria bacterium]
MVRIGIYGATGYTGFELIKLLLRHPQAEIVFATARSAAGQRLSDVFPTTIDLPLVGADQADLSAVDLIFTCLPHGAPELITIAEAALAAGKRVIDFSDTFRILDADVYTRWRGKPHPAPELLSAAVYGLPELHRTAVRSARLVANTGCYPLTVILPLHPLMKAGLLADRTVIADSKSGVSGAGRSLALKTHFGEAHENFSAYNIGRSHRHIAEMEQETGARIIFSPHLLPVFRGILSTLYVNLKPGIKVDEVRAAYDIFAAEPFVKLLPPGKLPELCHVVNTNQLLIGLQAVDEAEGRYILVACEDNLIKGASGQAVQNMNVMFALEETLGLI